MKQLLSTILAALTIIALTACGGSDKPDDDWHAPDITASTYTQSVPAGSFTLAAGASSIDRSIVVIKHHVDRPSKLTITAAATNVRAIALRPQDTAGMRWTIKVNGAQLAAGSVLGSDLGAGGVTGSTSHEIGISGGATVEVEVVGFIKTGGTAAGIEWDSVQLKAEISKL